MLEREAVMLELEAVMLELEAVMLEFGKFDFLIRNFLLTLCRNLKLMVQRWEAWRFVF